nr:MAG: hypothetical protein [Microvirus sp.]
MKYIDWIIFILKKVIKILTLKSENKPLTPEELEKLVLSQKKLEEYEKEKLQKRG